MCRMCYRVHLGIPEKQMEFSDFEAIISRLPRSLSRLSLTGLGEGLTHPDFTKMLMLAKNKLPGTKIDVTTNGILLDKSMRQSVINSRLWMLTLSIERLEDEVGGVTHPARRDAMANFRAFVEENVKAGRPVRSRLQVILLNEPQIRAMVDLAARTGVERINFVRMDVAPGSGIMRPSEDEIRRLYMLARNLCRRAGIGYFCINDQNIFLRMATRYDRGCVLCDNYAYIDVDGNVLPCCFMRDCSFGNIKAESLPVIWRSKRHRAFSPQGTAACQSCDIYKYHYNH